MSLTISEVFDKIGSVISPLTPEIITLEEAQGRVIASSLIARYPLPRFNNSAMDGFVARLQDKGTTVCVTRTIFAGDLSCNLHEGEVAKIMTGAPIPQGGECVIPIEDTTIDQKGFVTLPHTLRPQSHIRFEGEDVPQGVELIPQGKILSWGDISLLATQGVTHVMVYRRPKVVIFATGEELLPHWEVLQPHQIYNSNSPLLLTKAQQCGAQASFLQASCDTLDSIKANIKNALGADLIITTGGASVGDADLTKKALIDMGMEEVFTKVHIKPGKPTSLGKIGATYVLILPGNPLACGVNFALFGRSLIYALSGATTIYPATFPTILTQELSLKGGISTLILGTLNHHGFTPLEKQGPNMVSPLAQASHMIVVHHTTTLLPKGSLVYPIDITNEHLFTVPPRFTP